MLYFSLKSLRSILEREKPSKIVSVASKALQKPLGWAIKEIQGFTKQKILLVTVPDGEKAKSWESLKSLLSEFLRQKLDRKSLVLVLGGGTVGDLAGFASSIYLRGIRYVQIPTTLLAQADSAIGAKTAIDFLGYKNQLGAFYKPVAIIVDHRFIKVLPQKQLVDGLAEIIKMGFIKDPSILAIISKHGKCVFTNQKTLQQLVIKAIKAKQFFEEKDWYDKGIRQILNFGHTIGHAIELKYKLSHGQAVLLGMIKELKMAEAMGKASPTIRKQLEGILEKLEISVDEKRYTVKGESLAHDKKIQGNTIVLPIVTGIGKAKLIEIPLAKFFKTWKRAQSAQ